MNITKLFEMQRELDERIVKEKGLEGKDLLPQKILALQVELGECANEWRGFKFWSKNQNPRTEFIQPCFECNGEDIGMECHRCEGEGYEIKSNPLLEEYIDCLHFILSIGISLGENEARPQTIYDRSIVNLFSETITWDWQGHYGCGLTVFIELGKELGFTWDQIEAAYMDKNAVNHDRQSTGY